LIVCSIEGGLRVLHVTVCSPLKTIRNLFYLLRARSYLAVNTLCLSYKKRSIYVVEGNNHCLFWVPYETHTYIHCVGRT